MSKALTAIGCASVSVTRAAYRVCVAGCASQTEHDQTNKHVSQFLPPSKKHTIVTQVVYLHRARAEMEGEKHLRAAALAT